MEVMNKYYVYAYLREDGTPYYIGKGCANRIDSKYHPGISLPKPERRTKLHTNLTNEEACDKEKELIAHYGRKDLGTGILYNRTDGGDNPPTLKKNNPNHIAGLLRRYAKETPEEKAERARKISEARQRGGKGNSKPTRPVMIIETGEKFDSIKACAEHIGGDTSTIIKCINHNGQHHHRGYSFRRLD